VTVTDLGVNDGRVYMDGGNNIVVNESGTANIYVGGSLSTDPTGPSRSM